VRPFSDRHSAVVAFLRVDRIKMHAYLIVVETALLVLGLLDLYRNL
jgi:hypothetical protein